MNYNKSVSSGDDDELAHFVKWQPHKMAVRCIHMTALARGKREDGTSRGNAEIERLIICIPELSECSVH